MLQFSGPKYHISDANTQFALRRLYTAELCSPRGEVPWNFAVANRRARDDPHSKCVKCFGFSHAHDAVYGISECRFCENLRLVTLRSRLEVCEKESSIFPRRAPEASEASREPATWGSDVEPEELESEQMGLAFSLPPSPERVHDYLFS